MKILEKENYIKYNMIKYAKTERNVLKLMNHPFIVKLKYSFQTKKRMFLIMDYCPGYEKRLIIKKFIKII